MSEATPSHFTLEMDWNQMLINAGNATPVLTELDRTGRVAIYESPIMQRDVEGLRQLRSKITHPIALHFGDPPFPTVAREEACDGFVIGGGVASVLRQGALAAAFDKPFWLQMVGTGLTTALSLHLGAVLPMAQWPAVNCLNNYADDLLVEPLTIAGGYAQVPEGPGLGIEVDEAALARYRMQPPYELPKPRLLLSVVWPSGLVRHYADIHQVWNEAFQGSIPAQARGVRMQVTPDDGTPEWAELYARAQVAPVQDRAL
ncbi:MAG: Mandelate racemase [Actinobacteria bacterium ADurb.Bin444]|nr:MAG: Mandelate racemase [Actinobacteria bacterium ADurb.Bin444]